MPVRNCCLGCQGPMSGPCGPMSYRQECTGVGPWCVHAAGSQCSPCGEGMMHGACGGVAGSPSCGHCCNGCCAGGLFANCRGPFCG